MASDLASTGTQLALAEDKVKLLRKPTPPQFIDHREGPRGKQLAYVETGYVIAQLNKIFNHVWTFEVVREGQVGAHIWVLGRLKVMLSPEVVLTKEQYGSADVKLTREGKPISLGDDYKAAASDALKKCASLLGLASDVYFPRLHAKVKSMKQTVNPDDLPPEDKAELSRQLDSIQ